MPDLKTAAPADFARIREVMDAWWGRPHIAGILPRLFLDHFWRTSLIADDPDGLAGFLIGFASGSDTESVYIHAIGVAPHHRRSGLAREFYARFFTQMRAEGRTVVRAITSPANTTSISFHTALGFSVSDPIPDYDGPGADRVVFTRHL